MWRIGVCLVFCLLAVPSRGECQNVPAASRKFSLQAGVAGSSYSLDYGEGREEGFTIYADADFAFLHLGVEALYRDSSIITPHDIGENHLLAGPRIHFEKGRFMPYAKVLAGRGTINFQQGYNVSAYSQSYFALAFGAGLDIRVTKHINVRAIDFESQSWPTFKPNGLTPYGFSAGVAYRL